MVKLSKRLHTIASYVPEGAKVADIGSDHALLPVYLAQTGRIAYAVAGEINDGPFEAANKQVKEAGLGSVISVRQGNGLAVINEHEVDAITIAGMGGALIVSILEEGKPKLASVRTLILQPNVAEDQVRHWLVKNDWVLHDETVLEEDGKFYEILCAHRHPDAASANRELYRPKRLGEELIVESGELARYGPLLLTRGDAAFYHKWKSEIEKLSHIIAGMARGGTEAAHKRQQELVAERERIEEVLSCWQKVKPS